MEGVGMLWLAGFYYRLVWNLFFSFLTKDYKTRVRWRFGWVCVVLVTVCAVGDLGG
jgi:hypothetical protein